ncbi:protein kinase [bacterium]|nr:protein kinase [bacterium]
MTGQTIGDFRIIRELGRGGMGIVYEAEQALPRRRVALKVLPPELVHNSGVAARFREEANRMAQLDGHPNVATVYAAGEENDTAYFAMQLLTGGDLEQRLHREGRLDQKETAEIAAKVADALDHAHRQGVVHRDIKPANIMFDYRGEPVVTDFGIAKAADEIRMTLTGMSVCTPQYASPEQVKGNPIDGRSDLYALGVVLYQMVCGRPLFDCANPMSWALKHISEVPQPPSMWRPDLNGQLQTIVMKCLQKDPSERFANGADLAQALRGIDWSVVAPSPALSPVPPQPDPTVLVRPPEVTVGAHRAPRWPYAIAFMGIVGLILGAYLVGQAGREAPPPPKEGGAEAGQPTPNPLPTPSNPVRDAGLAIDAAYAQLGRQTLSHQESNRPWKEYRARHGNSSTSWHNFLTANADSLIRNDQQLGEQWAALANTLRQIQVPAGAPESFETMRQKMLSGAEAASARTRYSEQLMREELSGADPSWGKTTPYGQARSRMIEYIGDGGAVGGSAGRYYQLYFSPDLEKVR